jgi:UDP-glucose 4-epimerase
LNNPEPGARRRFLVTGSSGQFGVRTVNALVARGFPVIALDRQVPSGQFRSPSPLVEYVTSDLSDLGIAPDGLKISAAKVTDLVHLAARVNDHIPLTSPNAAEDLTGLVLGTIDLLRLVPNVRRIVFTSSVMVYKDTGNSVLTEVSDLGPSSFYAVLKAALEDYLQLYCESNDCRVAILRVASVYGSTLAGPSALPSFVRAALAGEPPVVSGPPDALRDRIHVDDAFSGLMLAVDGEASGIFNIGSGAASSTVEIARAAIKATGARVEPLIKQTPGHSSDGVSIEIDITRARDILGYNPKYNIDTGIETLVRELGHSVSG